ncbi:hypothetical protein WH47_04505 [Habropoda laboriosa]|uniref:NADH dehydrogenase [ubiquinone] 1 alpha subcomplex assembly factor 8 n=1 Tax=Habropoda laboriosa TaxID=597456 RepID=A0A0L7R2C1_9HYME|nr:PREDICTED: uncharacterized protein LOC108572663 [Habropoda laboriosa]XP_017790416.1 PREDICTED: uncharacterized protein LOC108572663 [Habropoda laboriosa]KOC64916.1 hypothetical protein WH47_04505 [Habropoda laboriosa]
MEAVKKARERFRKYPVVIAQCHESGSKYAACVLAKSNLKKNDCESEFKEFKACLTKVAAKNNIKL